MIRYPARNITEIRARAEVLLYECCKCMEAGDAGDTRLQMLAQALCAELNDLDVHQELPGQKSAA